jgi:hypothetical protein
MGWEQRNGRSYYYRKVRHGCTVQSEYVPAAIAGYAEYMDTSERAERDMARAAALAEREQHAARAGLVLDTLRMVRTLLAAHLSAFGYHQHKGTWRKKRGEPVNHVEHIRTLARIPEHDRAEIDAVLARLRKAKKPAEQDRALLHAYFTKYPHAWQVFGGDIAAHALSEMLDHMVGDLGTRTTLEAGIEGIKRDLGYSDAPALEKLLIDAVAIAWLGYYDTQRRHAAMMAESMSLEKAMYWHKHLTLAQGRYVRALETLARIRKMQLPALVQVNVNMAAKQHAPAPDALPAPDPASMMIVDHEPRRTTPTGAHTHEGEKK